MIGPRSSASLIGVGGALGLLLLGMLGCSDAPPAAPPEDGGLDAGLPFADTTVAFTQNGTVVDCLSDPTRSECAQSPVVGPKDGRTFALGPSDRIEVAFLNGFILERPSPSGDITPDFRIWATVPMGATAVVEVSFDGSTYRVLDQLDASDKLFALERIGATVIRFVRVVGSGSGGIAIDAIEAL